MLLNLSLFWLPTLLSHPFQCGPAVKSVVFPKAEKGTGMLNNWNCKRSRGQWDTGLELIARLGLIIEIVSDILEFEEDLETQHNFSETS